MKQMMCEKILPESQEHPIRECLTTNQSFYSSCIHFNLSSVGSVVYNSHCEPVNHG